MIMTETFTLVLKRLFLHLILLHTLIFTSWGGATAQTAEHSAPIYIRTNTLRWLTLTPDIGLEFRLKDNWAVLVNASYTSWSWDNNKRCYNLWEVAPEVRSYIGTKHRGYIGLMCKTGSFNYKLSATGKQGDIMGGGITGGYLLPLNHALSLDFSLGIGYIHAEYDRYRVIDGTRVRKNKDCKNWWGPISAGISIVWNPF